MVREFNNVTNCKDWLFKIFVQRKFNPILVIYLNGKQPFFVTLQSLKM